MTCRDRCRHCRARHVRRRFRPRGFEVVVIDCNGIATGTTAAGMGHIVVMDDSEAQFALDAILTAALEASCRRDAAVSANMNDCGTIWVAADDDEMNEVQRENMQFYASRGIATEILDERCTESKPNQTCEQASPAACLFASDQCCLSVDCIQYSCR